MLSDWSWIKAALICHGKIEPLIQIPPSSISESRSGPDAGSKAICLGYGSKGIRLSISSKPERYQLTMDESGLIILESGVELIRGLRLLPKIAHCHNQIFVNMDPRCKYHCRFCAPGDSPKFDDSKLIEFVTRNPGFPIAITSGIPDDESKVGSRICDLIRKIRKITDQPIGVEHLAADIDQLEQIYSSGADEFKLNLSFVDPELFQRFCPGLDQSKILDLLREAPNIFGRNKVCSNLFLGAGEDPLELIRGMRMLASWGVVPNLRFLRITPGNRSKLEPLLKQCFRYRQPWYLIGMGMAQKRILIRYGLNPGEFRTMCFACKLCDLVPMVDL